MGSLSLLCLIWLILSYKNTLKYMLIVAQSFSMVVAAIMTIAGSVSFTGNTSDGEPFPLGDSILLVSVGIITLLVSIFGCVGTKKENITMLYVYSGILVAMFIICYTCILYLINTWKKGDDVKMTASVMGVGIAVIGAGFGIPFIFQLKSRRSNEAELPT